MSDPYPAFGTLELDRVARSVTFRGRSIALSPCEFTILEALLERPGRPVSRMQLRCRLYGEREPQILGNPVQVHVHNLRAKLGEPVIRTLRNAGYLIQERWPLEASMAPCQDARYYRAH